MLRDDVLMQKLLVFKKHTLFGEQDALFVKEGGEKAQLEVDGTGLGVFFLYSSRGAPRLDR